MGIKQLNEELKTLLKEELSDKEHKNKTDFLFKDYGITKEELNTVLLNVLKFLKEVNKQDNDNLKEKEDWTDYDERVNKLDERMHLSELLENTIIPVINDVINSNY